MTRDEVVSLDGAAVRVRGELILGPVDLTIRPGEHWVVLGPNGSGKTTLLSLAAGRRQPSAGVVRVLGEELGRVDVRHLRRRIGHVSHAVADRIRPALAAMTSAATGPDAPTTVLATHHLEEVPSTVTHAVLLTAGRVVDRGPVEAVLSESALSRCYGLDIVVERRDGRWWARAR